MTTPTINSRPFHTPDDFWRVRSLLVETYPLTGPLFNWEIRRWDGWHYHRTASDWQALWEGHFQLWETGDHKLAGAVHPEGQGEAYLEIHPDYRCRLEEEMLAWAEEHLSAQAEDGRRQLSLFVWEYDAPRQRLLKERGFEKTSDTGMLRRLRFGAWPLPEVNMPPEYCLRTTRPGDLEDCRRLADLLNAAFHRAIHTAQEYANFSNYSPSFRHDLNLVAEAPDGSLAAHVGLTYAETNRYGIFEPVCTHPDHLRKGLASTLMFEGLHLLQALGAAEAYVDTGDAAPANKLYDSIGFTEAYLGCYWRKAW